MDRTVISTGVGDVGRHTHDGQEGFIVPVGDDAAMAYRISQLMDDPDQRARMEPAHGVAQAFQPEEIAG